MGDRFAELISQRQQSAPERMPGMDAGSGGDGEDSDNLSRRHTTDGHGERRVGSEPRDPGGGAFEMANGGIALTNGRGIRDDRLHDAEARLIEGNSLRGRSKTPIDRLVHVGYRAEAEQFEMLLAQTPTTCGARFCQQNQLPQQFVQRLATANRRDQSLSKFGHDGSQQQPLGPQQLDSGARERFELVWLSQPETAAFTKSIWPTYGCRCSMSAVD